MEFKLNPNPIDFNNRNNGTYQVAIAGSVAEYAQALYNELSGAGYSLLEDDILRIIITEVQYYSCWAVLEEQRLSNTVTLIGESVTIHAFEWAIIDPVARAHCDLQQAKLMEASRSLSAGEGFGFTVESASQVYIEARNRMQHEAFVEPPFSIKTLDGN